MPFNDFIAANTQVADEECGKDKGHKDIDDERAANLVAVFTSLAESKREYLLEEIQVL